MVVYDGDGKDGLPWWAIALVFFIMVVVIALLTGCSLGEQFREPMAEAAVGAAQLFTTETFWYDAARGILRAWTEAFPTAPTSPSIEPTSPSIDTTIASLIAAAAVAYPAVIRPIRLWLARRKDAKP